MVYPREIFIPLTGKNKQLKVINHSAGRAAKPAENDLKVSAWIQNAFTQGWITAPEPKVLTLTSLTMGETVTSILDEDAMGSDSDAALATQQSIKAYVDSQIGSVNSLQEVFDLGQTITIADTDNQTLAITNNDTTNNPDTVTITNTTSGLSLHIDGGSLQLAAANPISAILDEDTLASDSDTALATQQSIKAYVDANAGGSLQQAFDTGQTITIADADNQTLTINQNDVTNNPTALEITNTGTNPSLHIKSGELHVGEDDTEAGIIHLWSNAAGPRTGGQIIFETPPEDDGGTTNWTIKMDQDDLLIGHDGDDNIMEFRYGVYVLVNEPIECTDYMQCREGLIVIRDTATATAGGVDIGQNTTNVHITSADPNNRVLLDHTDIGAEVTIVTDSTGCELMVSGNGFINNVDCGTTSGTNELALAGDCIFKCYLYNYSGGIEYWTVWGWNKLTGAALATLVPDAV